MSESKDNYTEYQEFKDGVKTLRKGAYQVELTTIKEGNFSGYLVAEIGSTKLYQPFRDSKIFIVILNGNTSQTLSWI